MMALADKTGEEATVSIRLEDLMNGAGDGIRTRDIDLGKVALYQLSYSRLSETTIVS